MKKNKPSLTSISQPSLSQSLAYQTSLDSELASLEQSSKQNDYQILMKKNKLLIKELELQKQGRRSLEKELEAYRKVVLKNGDIHEILQMQGEKIFQLQTNLEVLQGKYDRLLSSSGSGQQTEYAIKCKELQSILRAKQQEHQKEVSQLKSKIMKMNASEIFQSSRSNMDMGMKGGTGTMTPIKNTRKLV